jgi:hypothetical protein
MSAANFRFFKTPDPADVRRIEQAERLWEKVKDQRVWPKGHALPYGYNTRVGNDLWVHGFHDWSDLFHRRQILCLATIETAIAALPQWFESAEPDEKLKCQEGLLVALNRSLDFNNCSTRYVVDTGKIHASLARHDFQPKVMPAEGSLWGGEELAQGSFPHFVDNYIEGKEFAYAPFDNGRVSHDDGGDNPFLRVPLGINGTEVLRTRLAETAADERGVRDLVRDRVHLGHNGKTSDPLSARPAANRERSKVYSWDSLLDLRVIILRGRSDFSSLTQSELVCAGPVCCDSRELRFIPDGSVDLVITDPPFGDNVNYGELSDFFYVWLAPILKGRYFDARGNDLFDHWEDEIMPRDRAERDGCFKHPSRRRLSRAVPASRPRPLATTTTRCVPPSPRPTVSSSPAASWRSPSIIMTCQRGGR